MEFLKSLNDIIIKESQELDSNVRAWAGHIQQQLGLKQFDVWPTGQRTIRLNLLIVPKDRRNEGLGSQAMNELIKYADLNNLRITLSPGLPDDHHGTTSRSRLVRFYKQFGFVENKGRKKDFSISDGMIREPRHS